MYGMFIRFGQLRSGLDPGSSLKVRRVFQTRLDEKKSDPAGRVRWKPSLPCDQKAHRGGLANLQRRLPDPVHRIQEALPQPSRDDPRCATKTPMTATIRSRRDRQQRRGHGRERFPGRRHNRLKTTRKRQRKRPGAEKPTRKEHKEGQRRRKPRRPRRRRRRPRRPRKAAVIKPRRRDMGPPPPKRVEGER